jgi:lipoprotein-anchoring transpeptidase ErfK/SrfK
MMKSHRFAAEMLRSKPFWYSAALTVAALGIWALPAFAWKANVETQPSTVSDETLVALQQSRRGRWIEIELNDQRLTAWEGNTPIRSFMVSTGKRGTPTPLGTYAIQSKYRSTPMQGEDYHVPDVPYAMYFSGGYAIHGAYWHNSFGTPISHGCVNMKVSSARWLYDWAPIGTPVVVRR